MIVEIIKAVVLGVVEGVTEFLPISSTGHLILVNQFLSFDKSFTVLFDVVIQLGAILAALFYFRKKLWQLNIWYKVIVAVLPALFFGALFGDFIESKLFNPWVVAVSLLVGGVIIILVETRSISSGQAIEEKITSPVENLSFKKSFLIGLIQCLAMIPGVSRSAATIMGGMVLGAGRRAATEFSFFLAIPTMFAASAYSLLKYEGALTSNQFFILSVGFVVSFFVALSVIKFLLNFIQKNNFKIFGYYRIVLGLLIIIYFIFF